MQQPIEQRDDAGGVWENLVPFLKRPVSSEVDWLALRRFLGAPLKPSRVIPQIRRVPADTQPLPVPQHQARVRKPRRRGLPVWSQVARIATQALRFHARGRTSGPFARWPQRSVCSNTSVWFPPPLKYAAPPSPAEGRFQHLGPLVCSRR